MKKFLVLVLMFVLVSGSVFAQAEKRMDSKFERILKIGVEQVLAGKEVNREFWIRNDVNLEDVSAAIGELFKRPAPFYKDNKFISLRKKQLIVLRRILGPEVKVDYYYANSFFDHFDIFIVFGEKERCVTIWEDKPYFRNKDYLPFSYNNE